VNLSKFSARDGTGPVSFTPNRPLGFRQKNAGRRLLEQHDGRR
jgi:hypothetical protein